MPRGGARIGAGRKPKPKPDDKGVVLGFVGGRRAEDPQAETPVVDAVAATSAFDALLEPPGDLPPAQQAFWRVWAPHAIEQGTLVPATVPGFRELCEQYALKAAIAQEIQSPTPVSRDADSLLRHYMRLAQRLDATLARFKLTALGKPVAPDGATGGLKTPTKANPWAKVART